jgi:pantoate--beta-alanine ligase
VEVVGCPIIRESDGLAKSSRNTYLSGSERQASLVLSRSLFKARDNIQAGLRDVSKIKELITDEINREPLAKIDYVEIVDSVNLQDVSSMDNKVLIALAVFIGKTRLIDNISI